MKRARGFSLWVVEVDGKYRETVRIETARPTLATVDKHFDKLRARYPNAKELGMTMQEVRK